MTDEIRFTHGGRDWIAYDYVNEANTRVLTRLRPAAKGRPFPTHQQYREAWDWFETHPELR